MFECQGIVPNSWAHFLQWTPFLLRYDCLPWAFCCKTKDCKSIVQFAEYHSKLLPRVSMLTHGYGIFALKIQPDDSRLFNYVSFNYNFNRIIVSVKSFHSIVLICFSRGIESRPLTWRYRWKDLPLHYRVLLLSAGQLCDPHLWF